MPRSFVSSSLLVLAACTGCGFPSYDFAPGGEQDGGVQVPPVQDTSVPDIEATSLPDIVVTDVPEEANDVGAVALCTDVEKNGLESDVDCGGETLCSRCAIGQRCSSPSDCASNSCVGGKCSAASCEDGSTNGTETDVDCGGSCALDCADGKHCLVGADCRSNSCIKGICEPPSCTDQVQNGTETDDDCGGLVCQKCAVRKRCLADGDCAERLCRDGTVAGIRVCVSAACTNREQDPAESDVDCGGKDCDKCSDGKKCLASSDCVSEVCGADGRCAVPACNDNVKNGTETDLDCGGGCATGVAASRCANLLNCAEAKDCQSGVCTGGKCQRPSCIDNVPNGDETDLDCGGSCQACADTLNCKVARDCQSGVCDPSSKTCAVPTCTDGVKNGQESDLDCGGALCRATSRCDDGAACGQNEDCKSGHCVNRVCVAAQCNDGIKNDTETDLDCGGPRCGNCGPGKACLVGSDCSSGVCSSTPRLCQEPKCPDGVKNQGETDLDCGGPNCATKCDPGKDCINNSDCASGFVCLSSVGSPRKVCTHEFQVLFTPNVAASQDKLTAFSVAIINNGTRSVLASRFKFVYWYSRDNDGPIGEVVARCTTSRFNNGYCMFSFLDHVPHVPSANTAMELTFSKSLDSDPNDGAVTAGSTWGPLPLSFDARYAALHANDYSWSATTPPGPWSRIGLYLDDVLVWGEPPGTNQP